MVAASRLLAFSACRLEEICGVRLDDGTIRSQVHREAQAPGRRREATPPAVFARSVSALVEVLVGGECAPGRSGRTYQLKIALFQDRPRDGPASTGGWAERESPVSSASAAWATAAACDAFAATWLGRARGPSIDPDGPLTVPADGAAWIWREAGEQFGNAGGVLDIFHASQHIAAAAWLEWAADVARRREFPRGRLMADSWPGKLDHIGVTAGP